MKRLNESDAEDVERSNEKSARRWWKERARQRGKLTRTRVSNLVRGIEAATTEAKPFSRQAQPKNNQENNF